MSGPFWRACFVVGLVMGTLAYGCGRTSLDEGFGPVDGAAGAPGAGGSGVGGSGVGGSGVNGQGGVVAGSTINCGASSKCLVGVQACCTPFSGTPPPYCIDDTDAQGCNGAVVCSTDIMCPKSAPHCCVVPRVGVGVCVPATFGCN